MTKFLHRFPLLAALLIPFFAVSAFAQAPINDDCANAIDLGPNYLNYCSTAGQYSNLNATASVFLGVPPAAQPLCFAGANNRDVWFHFQTNNLDTALTLTITGGGSLGFLHQPQVAVYRAGTFGCPAEAGDEELFCKRAVVNGNSVSVDLRGLDQVQDYYIRVNDYSASATPNSGNFTLCLAPYVPKTILDNDITTTACNGTLVDSGNSTGNYSAGDDYTLVISPPSSGCLLFTLDTLQVLGSSTFKIYDGLTATGTPLGSLTAASNSNNPRQYVGTSGAITIRFTANFSGATSTGFAGHWQCAPDCSVLLPCSAYVYDSGGPTGSYANNESTVHTYCPGAVGQRTNIYFDQLNITDGDSLYIYDGNSIAAPQIYQVNTASLAPTTDFQAVAGIANLGGCLTVRFVSNASGTSGGYRGHLSCSKPCQTIVPVLTSSIPAPIETGSVGTFPTINTCINQIVTVEATATYPQNNSLYPQNDNTSLYIFYWGDNDSTIVNGLPPHTASHTYTTPGIRFVDVVVTDPDTLCGVHSNRIRVRVAGRPHFNSSYFPALPICQGSTFTAQGAISGGGINGPGQVTLDSIVSNPPVVGGGQAFLPDVVGGVVQTYSSVIPIFGLNNINLGSVAGCSFQYVCLNIEHSFAGDLDIKLQCPNGTQVSLKNFPGGGGSFLGIANDDGTVTPGIGQDYCFNMSATTPLNTGPTGANPANTFVGGGSAQIQSHQFPGNGGVPINYSAAQQGNYLPNQPFSTFNGCPVNGNWTILVTDHQAIDNGYIFNWTLGLPACAFPTAETYAPLLNTLTWTTNAQGNIVSQNPTLPNIGVMTATPTTNSTAPVTVPYTITASVVGFNCTFDTTFNLTVNPTPSISPTRMRDTSICTSQPVLLDPGIGNGCPSTSFTSTSGTIVPESGATVTNVINVTGVPAACAGAVIPRVCFNINYQWDGDLNISLIPPGGGTPIVLTAGTTFGTNFTGTCFVPSGGASLAASAAPHTGTFAPVSGNLLAPATAGNLNGAWTLSLFDTFQDALPGANLTSWTLAFNTSAGISYAWASNPASTLTPTPTNTVTPVTTTTYTVTVSNSYGCSTSKAEVVTVGSIAAPAITCGTATSTSVTFNWNNVSGATSYNVTPNGGTVINQTPNSYTLTGLTPATAYTIQVQALGACTGVLSNLVCSTPAICSLGLTLNSTQATCGQNNGAITSTVTGTTFPSTYVWSSAAATGANPTGLPAGQYTVTVTDTSPLACTAIGTVVVNQPAASAATASATPTTCNGNSTGTATANPTGVATPFTYIWSDVAAQITQTATGLAAGTYTVTVTDGVGCNTTATAVVTQPTAVGPTATMTPVTCNGSSSGSATATPGGGSAPYTYLWSDVSAQNTQTAVALAAGTYTCTVTDANSCTGVTTILVTEPTVLSATATSTPALCNGGLGTVTGTPLGGTAPYTFVWDNSAITNPANATAGTHTVFVTDARSCTVSATVIVGQPTLLTVTTATTLALCNGGATGTATATPNGGSAPYTYLWSSAAQPTQTATALAAGTYTVTVTDGNACSTIQTAVVGQPSTVTVTISNSINPTCANLGLNGAATATGNGGTAPYTYSWGAGLTTATVTTFAVGTHTVTASDANGCTATASVTLITPGLPTVTITATQPSCGSNNGSVAANAAPATAAYTYLWNGGVPTQTRNGLTAGVYQVTATDAATQCRATASVTLLTSSAPQVSLSALQPNCGLLGNITTTVTSGAAPFTYTWSDATLAGANPTNVSAGTYTVTVTDNATCVSTASVVLNASNGVTISGAVTNVACFGNATGAIAVTAGGGAGAGSFTYAWASVQNTATINNLITGNYTVTVSSTNGCSLSASYNVGQPGAIVPFTSQTNALCFGGNGTMTAGANGGVAPYTYMWSSPITATTATVSAAAGSYTVTITDANLCTITATSYVGQPGALALFTSQTNATCFNGNGTMTANPNGGVGPYTYMWSSPITATTATVSAAAGTYTVTVTDTNGCMNSASSYVGQPGAIVPFTSQTNALCFGGNGTMTAGANGGVAPYTYMWSSPITATTATVSAAAGTYTVTITDANGCINSASSFVGQPGAIVPFTSQTNALCFGGNGTVTAAPNGGTAPFTFAWSGGLPPTATITAPAGDYTVTITDANGCIASASNFVGQPGALVLFTSQTNALCFGGNGTVTANPNGGVGPYTFAWSGGLPSTAIITAPAGDYTVTITDANGCMASASNFVGQPGALVPFTSQTNAICFGGLGSVTAGANGGISPYTYVWSTTPSQNTPTITPTAGDYTVTITDANGCMSTASSYVGQPGAIVPFMSQTNAVCFGGNGTVTANPNGGTAPFTYLWSFAAAATPTITAPSGDYTVSITDANGCISSASSYVGQPGPITTSTVQSNAFCFGGTGTMAVIANGGTSPFTYLWNTPTPQTTVTTTPVTAGSYQVTVTDAQGCTTIASSFVGQPGPFTVSLMADTTIFAGSTLVLQATPVAGASYLWSSGATTNPITVAPTVNTMYMVTVTNANGCVATAMTNVITQLASAQLPTFFTPNGDGQNDKFFIVSDDGSLEVTEFYVFNRWGQLMYNGFTGWDGKFNGEDQPMDTYVYLIIYRKNGVETKRSGDFLLVR